MSTIKTPNFNVFVGTGSKKRDITEMVESFKFENTVEKDNYLDIQIASTFLQTFSKTEAVVRGDLITFQFGYLKGLVSKVHSAVVTQVKRGYGERTTISVRALDKGNIMRKQSGVNKSFKQKTAAQILKEMAKASGIKKTVIEGGESQWKFLPMAGRNAMDIALMLAANEPGGNHIAYVSDDTLYYVEKGYSKISKRTFTYGDPNGGVISFNADESESGGGDKGAASGQTIVKSYDPLEKKPLGAIITGGNEVTKTTLGKNKVETSYATGNDVTFDSNANAINKTSGQQIETFAKDIGRKLIVPAKNKDNPQSNNVTAIGNKTKKSGSANILKGTLRLELDPTILPNDVITMEGVFDEDKGNWLVKTARHEVTNSGGFTTLEMEKNGQIRARKGKANISTNTNTKAGSSKSTNTTVVVFNSDANIIK